MFKIQAPTNCPSCNSVLEWSNQLLYCRSTACPAKESKVVEHFAKTMKIKGLGPAAVEKLSLSFPEDIYQLSLEEIAVGLKSEKLAEKLLGEINKSREAPANLVLPALGIPLIGKTATEKLSTVVNTILEIDRDSCVDAGLGPKATENLVSWLEQKNSLGYFDVLPVNLHFQKSERGQKVTNGVVCISGKLTSFKTKAEATQALESVGYAVKSSLTKAVTILVNESGIESAKTKQARDSGIQIVTNLSQFLGE